MDSIWLAHGEEAHNDHEMHDEHEDHGDEEHHHEDPDEHIDISDLKSISPEGLEITALLVRYKSPIAAVHMPRMINATPGLQAAAPAIEITRLFDLTAGLSGTIQAVAVILIIIGGMSVFMAVSNSSAAALYDMALMRSMGVKPLFIVNQRLIEGIAIALTSAVIGVIIAHLALLVLHQLYPPVAVFGLDGKQIYPVEWLLVAGTAVVGALASLWPAITSYRIDPAIY